MVGLEVLLQAQHSLLLAQGGGRAHGQAVDTAHFLTRGVPDGAGVGGEASPPPALLPPPPSTPRILCPASSFAAAADPGSGVSDGMSSNPLSAPSPVLKVCARHSNTVMSAEESRVQPPRGLSDSCSLRSAVYEERRRGHHPLVRGDGAPSISKRRRGTIHKYPPNVPHRQHRQHCW